MTATGPPAIGAACALLTASVLAAQAMPPAQRAHAQGDEPAGATDVASVEDDIFAREEIVATMYKVNSWTYSHPYVEDDRNWIRATYYTGVTALFRTTKDPRVLDQVMRWAEKHQWKEGDQDTAVNKLTVGQTYLELYFLKKDPAMIAGIRAYADELMATSPSRPRERWYYCDTLYVGPPTLAMLGKATGDRKYYDYLDKVYWDVTDHLFDKRYGLFYRDKSYFDAETARGKKVFWSRGNGWVIAGIPRVLEYLPGDHPSYDRYVDLLRTMAASIAKAQGDDGLWRANLADADQYPGPETSGTAFFCYALAWGINRGILDRQVYLPVVRKAWKGLGAAVDNHGRLGWVQPVGAAPAAASRDQTHEYAAGLFLLAGSEMVKLGRVTK